MNSNGQVSTIGIVVDTNNGLFRVWSRDHNDVHLVPNNQKPPKLGDLVIVKLASDRVTTNNYKMIPALFETHWNGRSVEVSIDQYLDFNQKTIESHFFGEIATSNNLSTKEGKWRLRIENQQSAENPQKSTWILKEIGGILEEDSIVTHKKSIGVTVTDQTSYAWCREKPPGFDIKLRADTGPELPIASWILMTFPSESHFQFNVSPSKLTRMEPIHETYECNKTIGMSLECFIKESAVPTDIEHPAVGLIINHENIVFSSTGKYKISIRRSQKQVGKDKRTSSVWFLRTAQLLETDNVKRGGYTSPTPPQLKLAIITGIRRELNRSEEVYFVTMDDHKDGRIYLEADSVKLDIALGVVFGGNPSNFQMLSGSKYKYNNKEFKLCGLYSNVAVRVRNDALQVHIFTDKYFPPTPTCKYYTVIHKDFGTILDNRELLRTDGNWNLLLNFWIRRCTVDGKATWAVCEKI